MKHLLIAKFIIILGLQISCGTAQKFPHRELSSLKIAKSIKFLNYDELEVLNKHPITCKKSKVPLFAKSHTLQMSLLTDMNQYTENSRGNIISVLSLKDKTGTAHITPVLMQKRGNSRGRHCEYKPLRFKFLDKELSETIEKEIGTYKANTDLDNYLKKYAQQLIKYLAKRKTDKYENISSMINDENLEILSNKPAHSLFKKLGDDVKLVTHCGKSSWPYIGEGEFSGKKGQELAKFRHQSEALWYNIINLVKMPTMKTRKVDINYIDINSNKLILQHSGYFRENPANIAKRCDLKNTLSEEENNYSFEPRLENKLAGTLLHEIVTTNDYRIKNGRDGHNIKHLYQVNEENKTIHSVFVPYDFDLSALIVPEYGKNYDRNLSEVANDIQGKIDDYISKAPAETYLFLREWAIRKDKILETIEASSTTDKVKSKFKEWYNEVLLNVVVKTFNTKFNKDITSRIESAKQSLDAKVKAIKDKSKMAKKEESEQALRLRREERARQQKLLDELF